ncbi:MAG: DMT family transporter [Deltaproteobacteria bacterium]|nr:DMT family transporter [Deltaproteobacteria bacterium]
MIDSKTYLPFVIIIGIVSVSFAGPVTSLIEMPPPAIAFVRLSLSFFILLPFFIKRCISGFVPTKRLLKFSFLSSIFLALHFVFWIASLHYTSVTSSVVLVTTNPLFVSVLSFFLLKEKAGKRVMFAVLVVIVGGVIISSGEEVSNLRLKGNLLALCGAIMASLYIITGRRVRQEYSLVEYTTILYFFASLNLFLVVMFFKIKVCGYPLDYYLLVLFLAIVPQLLGHNAFNWALKYLSSTNVAMLILFEPIGATILSYLMFGYIPSFNEVIGSIFILIGILISVI